jgi:hypothetical protein
MLELIPFTCGWLQVPLTFFLGGADNSIFRAPVPAYLIKHPAGLALFDTGLGLRFRREAASARTNLAANLTRALISPCGFARSTSTLPASSGS